jgi:hypothetical protein
MIGVRYEWSVVAVLAMLVLALFLGACGGGGVSSQDVQQQVQAALKKQKQQEELRNLRNQVNGLKHGQNGTTVSPGSSSSSGSSTSGSSCGGGVSVGANTSCGFAQNVADGYRATGDSVIRAYSPTTHDTYAMTCSGSNPTVCHGGNDATVYIY